MSDTNITESEPEPLKNKEIEKRLKELQSWSLSSDRTKISRTIEFNSFSEAISFVNNMAEFSEKTNHHPESIIIRFDEVEVNLTTSEIKGLSEKDFSLAKEIDFIAEWKVYLQEWLSSTKVVIALLILFGIVLLWRYFI